MEILNAIKSRRSIRQYTDKKIPKELIREIIDAGFCAPSAMNKRPWEFVVIEDQETRCKLADYGMYYKMLTHAPCAILVCGNTTLLQGDFLINDCSAATQNMLLAIHGLGLGGVWLGIKQDEMSDFYQDLFSLPKHIVPLALISFGYPAEKKENAVRYNEEHVHYEKYSI